MTVRFDHTIIQATDPDRSARFLADILGRPAPVRAGPFLVVALDDGVSLDFAAADQVRPQHYAFLIDEAEFDAVLARIRDQGFGWWADPWRRHPAAINHRDGGRGVYFADPDDHDMEVLTRRPGNGTR